jgi:hypothetical protein
MPWMMTPEEAYEEIRKAEETGEFELVLAMDQLPRELERLTSLRSLAIDCASGDLST